MTTDQERAAFGKRLSAVMHRLHVADYDLAFAIRVPPSYILRWRTGEGMPTDEAIGRLAKALSVPVTTLKPGHR